MVKKLVVAITSVVVSITHAGSAEAAPAWCKDAALGTSTYDLKDLSSPDVERVVVAFARAACTPTSEATARRAQIETARQAWSKKLYMIESDWADAVAYAGGRLGHTVSISDESTVDKRPWSTFDPIDQYVLITDDTGTSGDFRLDKHYFVDALGPRLSEAGRLAYIAPCISSRNSGPVHWAMCQGDIAQLDLDKLASELRANKRYSGADKMAIRFAVHGLKPVLAAHAEKIKKLLASDPGYAKVFELAFATRKEWGGRYKTDAALIELAAAMDDARVTRSRKALAGCEDTTWAAWKTAMATVPAKAFEGMHDDLDNGKTFKDFAMGPIIGTPSVYLASVALNTCMTIGQDEDAKVDTLVHSLARAMQRWPGFRGPRTATQSAIMKAGIVFDDRDATLDYPAVHRQFAGGSGTGGGGSGVIASMKPSGTLMAVEFKKQLVKQKQCAVWKSNNRIEQIDTNGGLVYGGSCVKHETITIDKAHDRQLVNPRYLDGVKPGMFVAIEQDVAVVTWAKPGAPIPSMVFGVPLK